MLKITVYRYFPKKFDLRHWLLTAFALGMASIFAYWTDRAGLGGIAAMMLFTILGTAAFIAISGGDRLYFTALFTTTFTSLVVAVTFVENYFLYPVVGEKILPDFLIFCLFLYGVFVALPVAFVWILPKILKYARRDP